MVDKCLSCKECKGKCNKKGLPSVSKGSAYCENQRKVITRERLNPFARFQMKFRQMKKALGFVKGFRK